MLGGGAQRQQRFQLSATTGGGDGGAGKGGSKPVGMGGSGGAEPGGPWSWYLSCLESQPLLTKALTCALLNALGDILCQLFIEKGGEFDVKRTLTFTFMGFALVGPTLHFWYNLLSRLVTAQGAVGAVLRLLLDQVVFAPIFLSIFIGVLYTIEGKSDQVVAKLKQDMFETVKANWILWVPTQYFNFRFVPLRLQVLVANVVALLWNTYMSFQSHKAVVVEPAVAATTAAKR